MSIQVNFSHPNYKQGQFFEDQFLGDQYEYLQKISTDSENGFFHAFFSKEDLKKVKQAHQKFKNKKYFIHIGIGGSSLGPEMLIHSLGKESSTQFLFINNIDPDEIHDQLKKIDFKQSLFSFVSKSGSTIETTAALNLISNSLFEQGIQKNELKDYFVFTTDPKKSQLKDLADELSITTLPIPSNIGGRFSVLTAVGLFPALFAQIDIEKLLEGAERIKDHILAPAQENQLLNSASYLYGLLKEKNVNQTVFMPYSSKLKSLSFWFTQLWAESLGKENSLDGQKIEAGLTPIPAYGPTDQHSQMQLFLEGPRDKCLIFLEIENFQHDYFLTSAFSTPSSKNLNSYRLSQLMTAQLQGTQSALKEKNRPFINLKISKVSPDTLGATILWLETLTAVMGHYLKIDPFNQPGVEAGKKYALGWLKKHE